MQAVLLAAGQSSRFFPYNTHHKSHFKLLGKTILEHTIDAVIKAGITDIIIVVSKDSSLKGIPRPQQGNVTFVEQDDAHGMGDAVLQVKGRITGDFFLLHGHHADFADFAKEMIDKKHDSDTVVLLGREEEEVKRFGVLDVDGDTVRDLIEKPEHPEQYSKLRIIGIYLLTQSFLSTLTETPKEHYNFEAALATYAKEKSAKVVKTEKPVVTLKYPWDLLGFQQYLLDNLQTNIAKTATIAQSAQIDGNVVIGEDAEIMDGVVIKGPAYIGKKAKVGSNALLRNYVSIGDASVVGSNMEVKNSILQDNATTHSGFIGDSVVGEGSKIAAGFITGNVRLDRTPVKVKVQDASVQTSLVKLGVFMGSNVRVGIRVATMPGVIIGNDTLIGPSTTVFRNIPSGKIYYTKFQEVVTENREEELASEKILTRDTTSQKTVLFDIDYTLFDTGGFKDSNLTNYALYQEVVETITELQNIAQLGIFSEGDLAFQERKLHETAIYEQFHRKHLHIVAKKEDELKKILAQYEGEHLFMVDDKLPILKMAKELKPQVMTIWIKRGPFAESEKNPEGFVPDATVTKLSDVVAIIANTN
jgi:UDP-N-acetylglucosamine diphosphorylase / glucose-1-phosphate thymidylyltransferase / UDP-N-acetylgalactosamine diphosphorylase / glucosamine-1-phosphate N-acetyltransferase / galactosamine-1-phosphate N-acetyltransferase